MGSDKLPKRLSQSSAERLLLQNGWITEKGGKHVVKMVKHGERPITLPRHKGAEYGASLTNAILKQAGLKASDDHGDG